MTLRSLRWCQVLDPADAEALATLFDALGIERTHFDDEAAEGATSGAFTGAVFPSTATGSWVEVWPSGPGMEPSTMLQLVVDDADACAERARAAGYEPQGPTDAHGERIYVLAGPAGTTLSFQSPVP